MRALVLLLAIAIAAACGGSNFDPASKITSVRILATRADEPYAKPGDTVDLEVLAYDARVDKSRPMTIYWLPTPCFNPRGDAYYACYAALPAVLSPGIDLTPRLQTGTHFSFSIPSDVIATHGAGRGSTPYGLAVVFTMACAGHVEYLAPVVGGSPNAVPFGCFGEDGKQLDADQSVFAFSLVYVFTDRTNTNPVIDHLTFGGAPVDPVAGVALDHCTSSSNSGCAPTPIDIVVPDSSQEIDPGTLDPNGNPVKEQVWVDYYVTDGRLHDDAIILFDPIAGRMPSTGDDYRPPTAAGEQTLWAVVHDNRGGASWLSVPVHVR